MLLEVVLKSEPGGKFVYEQKIIKHIHYSKTNFDQNLKYIIDIICE